MRYLIDGYLRPLLCAAPFLLVPLLRGPGAAADYSAIPSLILATTVSLIAVWRFGLFSDERKSILFSVGFGSNERARTDSY